ncbi:MAG TPA: hypothetical protein VLX92_10625 [Kofleriaceae bacterium]|nr:hypothetical protein [Kofleriaceae bacterium]
MSKQIWLCAALALVACGKKDGDKAKESKAPPVAIDIAAVNALVPAALKDKIVFEQRTIELEQGRKHRKFTLAVPKNWTLQDKMFGMVKADDKGGFFSKLTIGDSCGGACEAGKDWAKVADGEQFANRAKGKVEKDDKGAGRRTMISVDDNTKVTNVNTAWWTDGASRYFDCSYDLDESIKDAAPAFEKACSAVNVEGDD